MKKPMEYYSKSLKRVSKKLKGKRHAIAADRLERFSAMIYKQTRDRNEKFDLIIAPGNSGLFMAEITAMVYTHLDMRLPEVHVIPIYRDGTDNSYEIKVKANEVKNVLFVDDEIMTGTSLKHCILSLIPQANSSHIDFVVVTENMFFEWHNRIPGISVYFYPYAKTVHGLTNNISFLLNDKDFKKISKIVPVIAEKKQVMALLLSGKVKDKDNDGNWYFDETVETKVSRRLEEYPMMKRHLVNEINIHIKSGIQNYKDGDIEFGVK